MHAEIFREKWTDVCNIFWCLQFTLVGKNGWYMNKYVTKWVYSKMFVVECRWCVYENSLPSSFNMGVYLKFFTIKLDKKYTKDVINAHY